MALNSKLKTLRQVETDCEREEEAFFLEFLVWLSALKSNKYP